MSKNEFNVFFGSTKKGEVSPEQAKWVAKFKKCLEANKIKIDQVITLADRDESGTLSLRELKRFQKERLDVLKPTYNDLTQILNAFDINGDGYID